MKIDIKRKRQTHVIVNIPPWLCVFIAIAILGIIAMAFAWLGMIVIQVSF